MDFVPDFGTEPIAKSVSVVIIPASSEGIMVVTTNPILCPIILIGIESPFVTTRPSNNSGKYSSRPTTFRSSVGDRTICSSFGALTFRMVTLSSMPTPKLFLV